MIFTPSLWGLGAKIAAAAGIVVLIFGAGTWAGAKWTGTAFEKYKAEVAQEKLEQQTALLKAISEANARTAEVESAYQEEIARLKMRVRTITKEVIREVEKPVYHECVLPESGRVLLDDAIRAANTAAGFDGEVPPDPEPASQDDGGSADFFN